MKKQENRTRKALKKKLVVTHADLLKRFERQEEKKIKRLYGR